MKYNNNVYLLGYSWPYACLFVFHYLYTKVKMKESTACKQ